MNIPIILDNQQHRTADVLNTMLAEHWGRARAVATAYFNIGGWPLLQTGLEGRGHFRLPIGAEPETGADVGWREAATRPVKGLIRNLASEPFGGTTLRLVEELIAFRGREDVEVRLYT